MLYVTTPKRLNYITSAKPDSESYLTQLRFIMVTPKIKEYVQIASEIAQNPKVGASVGAATAAMGGFLDHLPEKDLAKIATLLGIVLTSMLIIIHGLKLCGMVRRSWRNRKANR